MKKSWIWIIAAAILAACCGIYVSNQNSQSAHMLMKKNKSKRNNQILDKLSGKLHSTGEHGSMTHKKHHTKEYSNDQWMLMGYMAYARNGYEESRHIKNTQELVDDVAQDLKNGDLTAEQTDKNAYHLTNKYGSVDATVNTDDVKITGDNTTTFSKDELRDKFSSYDEIGSMTQFITKGGSKQEAADHSSKSNEDFNNDEIITAAYIDNYADGNEVDKIHSVQDTLAKDKTRDMSKFPSDYFISGFYQDGDWTAIAIKLTGTVREDLKIEGDKVILQPGGPGTDDSTPKEYRSILDLKKRYKNHKSEIDQILNDIKYNKSQVGHLMDL